MGTSLGCTLRPQHRGAAACFGVGMHPLLPGGPTQLWGSTEQLKAWPRLLWEGRGGEQRRPGVALRSPRSPAGQQGPLHPVSSVPSHPFPRSPFPRSIWGACRRVLGTGLVVVSPPGGGEATPGNLQRAAGADKWPSLETTRSRCSPGLGLRDPAGLFHPQACRSPEDQSLLEAAFLLLSGTTRKEREAPGPPGLSPQSREGRETWVQDGKGGSGSSGTAQAPEPSRHRGCGRRRRGCAWEPARQTGVYCLIVTASKDNGALLSLGIPLFAFAADPSRAVDGGFPRARQAPCVGH